MHARLINFFRALLVVSLFLFGGPQRNMAMAASAASSTPTVDFTDNADGTVTHKITGLTWKRCSEGQTWTGSSCAGTAQGYSWVQAAALSSTFAGKSDWRAPTIRELSSIVERGDSYYSGVKGVNSTIFPDTPLTYYWSASGYAGDQDGAWYIYFTNGQDYIGYKSDSYKVRLVRGELSSKGLLSSNRPVADYVDNGDGTVTHIPTDLTWKRCTEGQTWNGATCSGTPTHYTLDTATTLTSTFAGRSDWRLPTQEELRSLVDFTLTNPAINSTVFPNTPLSYFWPLSPFTGWNVAWLVSFGDGGDKPDYRSGHFLARLVRGGQSVRLAGVTLACPSVVSNAAVSGLCSVLASYSDTSSKAVSAVFGSSNVAVLDVRSNGSLIVGTPSVDSSVTISASYSEGGVSKTATAVVTVKAATTNPSSSRGPDCLFNWAEAHVPANFSPAGSSSQTSGAYYYRYYAKSESYLASSSDGNAYYADKSSGVVNLGPLTQWYATAGCQP